MAKNKVKKKTKLQEAELRILILEGEREHLRKSSMRQHELIHGLRRALVPFTFPNECSAFHGTDENLTRCYLKDLDVQHARTVILETQQI